MAPVPMLSGRLRRSEPRTKTGQPARGRLGIEANGDAVVFRIADVSVAALPEGALWIADDEALVVSDLHLEKGSAYARSGHRLPPYDTRTTLERLAALLLRLKPRTLIALGDSFHDRGAERRLDRTDREMLAGMTDSTDWVWIEGNHDPDPPVMKGRCESEIVLRGLVLRHEAHVDCEQGEISGHLHPCARVVSRSGSTRRRCFATDGMRLVMPAFGAYAGGLNVCDVAFAPLFPDGCHALMMGRTRVYPVAPDRLVAD